MKLAVDVAYEVGEPLQQVEELLHTSLSTAEPGVVPVLAHLLQSGGKRVRPLMTLLSTRLFTPDVAAAIPVAAAAELIHMATLIHDDVIDNADQRRRRVSVNQRWGNHRAVLAGDALLARALVMLVDAEFPPVVRIMSHMLQEMCEGEIAQYDTLRNTNQSEEDYFRRIERKTALFFAACCEAGAWVAGAPAADREAMREYGRLVGMAFQVIDDLLDVCADAEEMGKPVGNDLASGVLTLPVLYAIQQPGYGAEIRRSIERGPLTPGEIAHVIDCIRSNGAIDYTRNVARSLAEQAKAVLPEGNDPSIRYLLGEIADMVVTRPS